MSDSNRGYLAYRFETAFAETPGLTPALQTLRITDESCKEKILTVSSDEIRQDLNVSDIPIVGVDSDIKFNGNFSVGTVGTGTWDALIEGVFGGTWTANVLKNGSTKRSLLFEKAFTDLTKFITYRGCTLDGMTLSVQPRKQVKIGFTAMGQQPLPGNTSVATTTNAVTTSPEVTSGAAVSSILLASSPIPYAVKSIDLQIKRNHRGVLRPDTLYTDQHGQGAFEITGTLAVYMKDSALITNALANTSTQFGFVLGDVTNGKHTWTMPKIKWTDTEEVLAGTSSDVIQKLQFQALYDSGIGASAQITRA